MGVPLRRTQTHTHAHTRTHARTWKTSLANATPAAKAAAPVVTATCHTKQSHNGQPTTKTTSEQAHTWVHRRMDRQTHEGARAHAHTHTHAHTHVSFILPRESFCQPSPAVLKQQKQRTKKQTNKNKPNQTNQTNQTNRQNKEPVKRQ